MTTPKLTQRQCEASYALTELQAHALREACAGTICAWEHGATTISRLKRLGFLAVDLSARKP